MRVRVGQFSGPGKLEFESQNIYVGMSCMQRISDFL